MLKNVIYAFAYLCNFLSNYKQFLVGFSKNALIDLIAVFYISLFKKIEVQPEMHLKEQFGILEYFESKISFKNISYLISFNCLIVLVYNILVNNWKTIIPCL